MPTPRITPVFVYRRRDRGGWWIAWRDREHRACGPDCRVRNADGMHRVRAGNSKKEAERMADWVRNRLHPWNAAKRGIDWEYFVGLFMLSIAQRSAAHRKIAERVIARFTEQVAPEGSESVVASHVDAYLAELKGAKGQPASDRERMKHWRYLHALFGFGVARGHCSENPVARSSRPGLEEKWVRAPRWLDVLSLLGAVTRVRSNDPQGLYLLVLLAVVTGLRAADLLSLRMSDLELGSRETGGVGLWTARNRKGKKVKVCGLPATVERLVIQRMTTLPDRTERFFPVWPSFPHNAWERLRHEAKVECVRFQELRRAGGALAAATAVRKAGARQLQHSSLEVYGRHYEDLELEAIAVAGALTVPELPKMPTLMLGKKDSRGRYRVALDVPGENDG